MHSALKQIKYFHPQKLNAKQNGQKVWKTCQKLFMPKPRMFIQIWQFKDASW